MSIKIQKSIFLKKKKLIGICFENSENFLIIYLSIIKSGNTAVIFENGLSSERYIELLKKFNINIFITFKDFSNEVLKNNFKKDFKKKFMNCSNIFFYEKKLSYQKNKLHNINDDVAVVLFTSGSSGEKKGVMLTHSNLIFNSTSILKILPIISTDIVNLILPVSYSFGLSILHTHIKVGAKIYLHNSPFVGSIIKELKKYKCTSFYGVPSTYEILLNKTSFIKEKFIHLRYLAQAGGKLEINFKKMLISKYINRFYVMYGTTEASPRLSYVPPNILHKKIDSIGIPIPGVKFTLLKYKKSNNMLLAVSGKNIMKGYLNDIKLTKKYKKKKYLITGDFAYKDNDGYYYLKGRSDKIIKRFGYKVNLDLIKSFVNKINNVVNSELFLDNNKDLILLVQVSKNKNSIEKIVKLHLLKRFPRYERPDRIVFVKEKLKDFDKKISYFDIYNKYMV